MNNTEKNNIYISFNYNITSHAWSFMIYDALSGNFHGYQMERFNRYQKSPNIYVNDLEKYFEPFNRIIKELYHNLDDFNFIFINPPLSFKGFKNKKFLYINNHHLVHASSSYFSSGFKNSLVLVLDLAGPDIYGDCFQSIWKGDGDELKMISSSRSDNGLFGLGLGIGYFLHSMFIGYKEGIVMGLASYGNSSFMSDKKIFRYDNGSVYLVDDFLSGLDEYEEDEISKIFVANLSYVDKKSVVYNKIINNFLEFYGIDINAYDSRFESITTSIFADISAKLQKELEDALEYIITYYNNGYENLCITGGVAYNSVGVGKINDLGIFKNIYTEFAPDDAGLCNGLLLSVLKSDGYDVSSIYDKTSFGLDYVNLDNYIEKYLDNLYLVGKASISEVSKLIYDGKIIVNYSGGSEYGARALGHRSILASPSYNGIRDRVNNIKNRYLWRPVGVIVLEDIVSLIFKKGTKSTYMNMVGYLNEEYKDYFSEAYHVDNSLRYQTISSKSPDLGFVYDLLLELEKTYRIKGLINTSLNGGGEPIIETPDEAIRFFLSGDSDFLLIGGKIYGKKIKDTSYKFNYKKEVSIDEYNNSTYIHYGNLIGSLIFKGLGDFKLLDLKEKRVGFSVDINGIKGDLYLFPLDRSIFTDKNIKNLKYFSFFHSLRFENKDDLLSKKILFLDEKYGEQIKYLIDCSILLNRQLS